MNYHTKVKMGICGLLGGETKKRKQYQDAVEDIKINKRRRRYRNNSDIICYQCYNPYLQGTRQDHIRSKEHIKWLRDDAAKNILTYGIENIDKNDT